ncbi:hypothetical protein EVA_05876 [gut metagenome]|uniref:Uncharacterized protein n=1 Tax=gut metagenome TaxID=749906 RepID=J9D0E3_9ZZZZ
MGRERKNRSIPEEPVRRLFIIPGNNSATGIKDNLISANGVGLIFETEADTMSSAIAADYGHWTDTLRKGYDNDEITFARRMGNEYKRCQRTCFSVMLTGTFGQIPSLIPARNDGTLSRFLFYNLPPINDWMNQFNKDHTNYSDLFLHWGEGWKQFLDLLRANVSCIELQITEAQQNIFNERLSKIFNRSILLKDETMKSTVARLGLGLIRMMCTVAFLRATDHLLSEGNPFEQRWQEEDIRKNFGDALLSSPYFQLPADVPTENGHDGTWSTLDMLISDEDFAAVLNMAEPLAAHSSFVIAYLPKDTAQPEPITESALLQRMPIEFKREEALKVAEEMGLSTRKLDRILAAGVEKGILERTKNGYYTFKSKVKK